jgi:hyperosmotically inducible periplasmic protein
MKRYRTAATVTVLYLAWVVILVACHTPAGRSAGEVVDDASITTKVKAKLLQDSVLEGVAVSVETFEGEVTLTGAVNTQEEKDRAASLALDTGGVRRVNNLIKIKSEPAGTEAEPTTK